MYIRTNSESFEPKDFIILNFYGTGTCFAWNENEFVCFPYIYQNSTEELKVLKAPAHIKDIREFDQRIFVLCHPSGIYKFTGNLGFALLSRAAIELGSNFFEVIAPSTNGGIILEDKRKKTFNKICSKPPKSDIHVLSLNYSKIDKSLRKLLFSIDSNEDVDVCIVSHDNQLFKMYNQAAQIIYRCDHLIKNIYPIEKQGKIIGFILQVNANIAVLIQVVDNKLQYDKITLGTNAHTMSAIVDDSDTNELLLIYSDNTKTYYSRAMLFGNSTPEIKTEEKHYESIRVYQSKFIIYLNSFSELLQVPIEQLKNLCKQNTSDYMQLESNMLKGLEDIIKSVCDKAVELEKLNEKLAKKEDKLKRINIFVNKQRMKYHPEDQIMRLLNQTFLISNFKKVLPENSIIVKMVKCEGKTSFSMKNVQDCDTIVEMPICISNLTHRLYTTTDLITYKNNGGLWCLIKNYIQDPSYNKKNKIHLPAEKRNFLEYKLIVLGNLLKENNISMEDLVKIKREMREKLLDIKIEE